MKSPVVSVMTITQAAAIIPNDRTKNKFNTRLTNVFIIPKGKKDLTRFELCTTVAKGELRKNKNMTKEKILKI